MWIKWVVLIAVWVLVTILPIPRLAREGNFVHTYLWLLVMTCVLVVSYALLGGYNVSTQMVVP